MSNRVLLALFLTVVAVGACTDEEIVFRDRQLFNPPPDVASGFLGYFTVADKMTSCGNCHVGIQGEWENTPHASAHEDLVSSGSQQDFCFGCHTVSERGNPVTTAAGWNAVQDSAYQDVQCESCHGPGITHVENPDASQPIPSIALGANADQSCAECHQGDHQPFAEEWSQSKHAAPNGTVLFLNGLNSAQYTVCLDCHTAQGALAAWGVVDEYVERDDAVADHLGITCAVCHDPHGSPHDAQLRFAIDVPSQQQNLCIKCHHKRAAPETDAETLRGPHSPEGPLLLGEGAGWFPPGFQASLDTAGVDRILGTHGTIANPKMCATCHVSKFTVNDAVTGDFVFNSTGHLFLAIPCVDSNGLPTTDQDCQVSERTFAGCTASGCHGSEAAAVSAYTTAMTRTTGLVAEVDSLLALAGYDPAVDRGDGVFTVGDGAWFNARLGELPGTPVHNPFLIEQLLEATKTAVINEYNLAPPAVSSTSSQQQ